MRLLCPFLLFHCLLMNLNYLAPDYFFHSLGVARGSWKGAKEDRSSCCQCISSRIYKRANAQSSHCSAYTSMPLFCIPLSSLLLSSNFHSPHHSLSLYSPLPSPWPQIMFSPACDKWLNMNWITPDSFKSCSASKTTEIHVILKKLKWWGLTESVHEDPG